MKLLTNARSNPKTAKMLDQFGFEAVIMHLSPNTVADGKRTVCPWSTEGCREVCLDTSGHGRTKTVQNARKKRTMFWLDDRALFLTQLDIELGLLDKRATNKGLTAIARLNGTSDIKWEKYIINEFPSIQFYDYTKSKDRVWYMTQYTNYHLTYSMSEKTKDSEIINGDLCNEDINMAVVFRKTLPKTFLGIEVIDGTAHDFRFLDPKGVIVGLTAKGKAIKSPTSFVIEEDDPRRG